MWETSETIFFQLNSEIFTLLCCCWICRAERRLWTNFVDNFIMQLTLACSPWRLHIIVENENRFESAKLYMILVQKYNSLITDARMWNSCKFIIFFFDHDIFHWWWSVKKSDLKFSLFSLLWQFFLYSMFKNWL